MVQVVNHLFKVESSNVVIPEVNSDLICISFPLVIRNNNVLIEHAYSDIHMQGKTPCRRSKDASCKLTDNVSVKVALER